MDAFRMEIDKNEIKGNRYAKQLLKDIKREIRLIIKASKYIDKLKYCEWTIGREIVEQIVGCVSDYYLIALENQLEET